MTATFSSTKKIADLPRLPLKGSLDLTYRCNNRCLHCWLRTSDGRGELSTHEILTLVDDARAMGCREWAISGGEPMLRPDFPEIFDYITSHAKSYSLNTNGTLITPEIAELMKRKGSKMVALYGATAKVHDHVTQNPGSYAATMLGFKLLKDAGAGFTVQLVPMKDNWHEFPAMVELAKSLSPHYRIGAPWLYLSAGLDPVRNAEIDSQRLSPRDVVELDRPDFSSPDGEDDGGHPKCPAGDDLLFAACIANRRDFHVDPHGMMSFCSFIKDPAMRYDLRKGTFHDAWERFIPLLADKVRGGEEYVKNCGSCDYRKDCRWCAVYGYLEHGRYSAKVEHLCDVARENRVCRERMLRDHRRYVRIGGITIQVDSDLPFSETTFDKEFDRFHVDGPGEDTVSIRHHFDLPDLPEERRGEEMYRKSSWAIYRKGQSWIYTGIPADGTILPLHNIAVFSEDHTSGRIYHDKTREENFRKGNLTSLTLFLSDQILVARLLADRNGFILHSAGAIINGKGVLFVGHPEADKNPMTDILNRAGARGEMDIKILCDDRNIIRRQPEGWNVYGTWNHGDVPDISSRSAPLHSIIFIEKSDVNRIIQIEDRDEIVRRLLACLIRPFVTAGWEEKTLTYVERMAQEVPCYVMPFDKSGAIIEEMMRI